MLLLLILFGLIYYPIIFFKFMKKMHLLFLRYFFVDYWFVSVINQNYQVTNYDQLYIVQRMPFNDKLQSIALSSLSILIQPIELGQLVQRLVLCT